MSPVGVPEDPYVENPDFVPNPIDRRGTVETLNGPGDATQASGIFEHHRHATALVAERALDPEDPTPDRLVVLPEADLIVNKDPQEEARTKVAANADRARDAGLESPADAPTRASQGLGLAPSGAEGPADVPEPAGEALARPGQPGTGPDNERSQADAALESRDPRSPGGSQAAPPPGTPGSAPAAQAPGGNQPPGAAPGAQQS